MQPVYIIAEAGVNHNGDEDLARRLVDIAAECKADAVKFQLFNPSALVTRQAPKADYQSRNLGESDSSQLAMLERLTLPLEAYIRLDEYCRTKGVDFLCTPFDLESLAFLTANTSMRAIKLPSGEITNGPLLLAAARTGKPVILSTGMANLEEIDTALSILHFGYVHESGNPGTPCQSTPAMLKELQGKVSMLHCVSQYPAPYEAVNLRAMGSLAERFGLSTGLSDHTLGTAIALAAVALGATCIEKHYTYDTKAPGPDHPASLMPEELAAMIRSIRQVSIALGSAVKECQASELNTRDVARKSLIAACDIRQGEIFTETNLTAKRPGTGQLAPNHLWQLLGKPASRAYSAEEGIDASELTLERKVA